MPPWIACCPRYFISRFGFLAALSLVVTPLLAQSVDTSDATQPTAPAPAEAVANPPSAPLPVTPASAASTPATASPALPDISNLSSAAGPTPVSGPGSGAATNLGDRLGSATLSTKLPFRVTATLGEVYNNNIFNQPHKTSDFVTRLSLNGELQLGDIHQTDGNFLDVVYMPTGHIYADHPHENGVDQNVDVLYAHHWTRLTLSLEQIYTRTQETDSALGGLVTGDVYSTIAKANFAYSMKLDLLATFKQDFTSYDQAGYTDSRQWAGEFYALYHYDSKLSLGFGPRIGYLNLEKAPDETFEQALFRAIYVASDKLNFQGAAGAEVRQYQTVSRSDTVEPIFELSGVYLPFPSTSISLNATRRFAPSYNFVGQDYIATNVYLTATQRFLGAYYLRLTTGYENDDYQFVADHVAGPSREDNYFYVQPSLHWKPNGWLELGIFDKYEEDNSNFAAFSYDTNQVGVSCSATY